MTKYALLMWLRTHSEKLKLSNGVLSRGLLSERGKFVAPDYSGRLVLLNLDNSETSVILALLASTEEQRGLLSEGAIVTLPRNPGSRFVNLINKVFVPLFPKWVWKSFLITTSPVSRAVCGDCFKLQTGRKKWSKLWLRTLFCLRGHYWERSSTKREIYSS